MDATSNTSRHTRRNPIALNEQYEQQIITPLLRDCPHIFLDRCLQHIELTLNVLHLYEYDPRISAYHGIFGCPFDFMSYPIAPAGSKVLIWDSPDHRSSWADHGTEGIYLGPALNHFRAFRIWVSQTLAMRVSASESSRILVPMTTF